MRPTKPPRLKLRKARKGDRRALWVIAHLGREIGTGFGEGERSAAEAALARYILRNRTFQFGDGDPNQVLIGDVLAIYAQKHGPTIARPKGLAVEIERLAEF